MSSAWITELWGFCGAALVGLGLYGTFFLGSSLRRVVAFNLVGAGIFLLFGVVARRGGGGAWSSDPVPQAMVITGIVVAFAGTTLALALIRRLDACAGDADRRESDAPLSTGTTPDEEPRT